jgi:uncharacterized membrane protein YdjX (TVP38/TMEM64 family)
MMPTAERAEHKPAPWTLIFLAVVLIAAGAAWLLLPLREWLELFERWIIGLGAWGVALFALVYILATISLAPEWPLTVAAGLLYGAWGFPITVVTATIAASLAFLIARHFARDRVRSLLERRRVFSAIDDAVAQEGWKVIALLRLSPAVPFNLQNYVFGVTAIPFWQFVTATLGGIIPGTVLYVYIGVIGQAVGSGNASGGPLQWGFFGIGLLATVVVVVLVTRKAFTKLKRAGIDDRNP